MERKVTYVEPDDYFTEAMLKAAEEYDRTHELEKAAEESNKAANIQQANCITQFQKEEA